jgi:hypothetical protein
MPFAAWPTWIERLSRILRTRGTSREQLEVDDTGLRLVRRGAVVVSVPWGGLERVEAVQRDRVTLDVVEIQLVPAGGGPGLRVSEDCAAFDEVARRIEDHFGVARADWFDAVAFPPFEPRRMVLWQRDRGTGRGAR